MKKPGELGFNLSGLEAAGISLFDLARQQRREQEIAAMDEKQRLVAEACQKAAVVSIFSVEDLYSTTFCRHTHSHHIADVMADEIIALRKRIKELERGY